MIVCAGEVGRTLGELGTWYPGGVQHDGNGWVECGLGHRHWGRHGAAGLLVHAVDDAGTLRVLLQHRAEWSHHGGTWGLPGGARDSHEDVVTAALREAAEETALDPDQLRTRHTFVDDHGGWSYTTVFADTPRPLGTRLNRESVGLEWVPSAEVARLGLHPGFGHTWPAVRVPPVTVVVDAANVVGARPNGWWRDRAGATGRLLEHLDGLRAVTVNGPDGVHRVVVRVVAVVEGAARAAPDPEWARVRRAGGSGDDEVVIAVAELAGSAMIEDGGLVVVTADRGLRARVVSAAPGTHTPGPGWLVPLL